MASIDSPQIIALCESDEVVINADTERKLSFGAFEADTNRKVIMSVMLNADTDRYKSRGFEYLYQTRRKIPFNLDIDGNNDLGLISVQIDINAQTLTDTFSTSTVNHEIDCKNSIYGRIFDFDFNFDVERVQYNEMTRSISGMYDCDKLMNEYFTYQEKVTIHHDAITKTVIFPWSKEKKEITVKEAYDSEEYERLYASVHAQNIADGLGKELVLDIDHDFEYANSFTGTGQTYSNIVSSVFGWLSQVPTRIFNVFIRGDKLYIIQRGHETTTIDITDTKHTRPQVAREIVRNQITKTESELTQDDYDVEFSVSYTEEQWQEIPDEEFSQDGYGAVYADGLLAAQYSPTKVMEFQYEDDGVGGSHPTEIVTTTIGTSYDGQETTVEKMSYDDAEMTRLVGKTSTTTYSDGTKSDPTYTAIASTGTGYSSIADDDTNGLSWGTAAQSNSAYTRQQESRRVKVSDAKAEESYSVSTNSVTKTGDIYDFPIGHTYIDTENDTVRNTEEEYMEELAAEAKALDHTIKETLSMDIYDYDHAIDFFDKVIYAGNEYFLQSNSLYQDPSIKKQSVTLVRWHA